MKATTKKPLPAELGVEYTNQTGFHQAEILEDRGAFWKVLDDQEEEYQVKKTSITRYFDAADIDRPEPPAPTLSASLASLLNPKPTPAPAPVKAKAEAKAKADPDPELVTLATLCTEYGIVGRIARRRLRKEFSTLPTGDRWEWKKTDPNLIKVRALLAPAPAADPAPVPTVAEALATLGMTQEDLEAGLASAGEQGAAAAAAAE